MYLFGVDGCTFVRFSLTAHDHTSTIGCYTGPRVSSVPVLSQVKPHSSFH